jgi:hypothetical protein
MLILASADKISGWGCVYNLVVRRKSLDFLAA